jgi:hypothetical protein
MYVPASSALLCPVASLYMSSDMLDIYCAISALQRETDNPIRIETGSQPKSAAQARRFLACESMELALRLVYLGQMTSSRVVTRKTATDVSDSANMPAQLHECLRLTALLFVWRFQRRISVASRPMKLCHSWIASLLMSMEVKPVFMKPEGMPFGENLLLWTLVILGATASSQREIQICIELIQQHLPERICEDWEQVCSVCDAFLWLDLERQTLAKVFWKQVRGSDQGQGNAAQQHEQLP